MDWEETSSGIWRVQYGPHHVAVVHLYQRLKSDNRSQYVYGATVLLATGSGPATVSAADLVSEESAKAWAEAWCSSV